MSKLKTGYILEEQVAGIGRWFRTNAWIYEEKEKALDLAERRIESPSVTKIRILRIEHTDPREIHAIG